MWEDTELGNMMNRVRNLDPVRVFIKVSDTEVERQVAELNRDQLRKGKNALDQNLSDIGGPYSEFTLDLHPEKSKYVITLYDTGEYYDSIVARTDSNGGWEIQSDPMKEDFGRTTNLFERWGREIEGLTDENIDKIVTDILIGKYVEYLETQIF
jgi:hypothetical protein